jgi:hypothetical protein
MRAGRELLRAFSRRPGVFHTLLATPPGWRLFARFCRGEIAFDEVMNRTSVRLGLSALR